MKQRRTDEEFSEKWPSKIKDKNISPDFDKRFCKFEKLFEESAINFREQKNAKEVLERKLDLLTTTLSEFIKHLLVVEL